MAVKPRQVVRLAVGVVALTAFLPAAAGARPANPGLWSALNDKLICGVAIHAPGVPAYVLCADRVFPAPKGPVDGDPGFVYLGAHGHPRLARVSQYTWQQPDGWEKSHRATLKPGERWRRGGVTCSVHRTSVRCANRSHHGFTVTLSTFRPF